MAIPFIRNENFSEPDKKYASDHDVDSYLTTPTGDLKVLRSDGGRVDPVADDWFERDADDPDFKPGTKPHIYFDYFKDPDGSPYKTPSHDIEPIKDGNKRPGHDKPMCLGCYDQPQPWLQKEHTSNTDNTNN